MLKTSVFGENIFILKSTEPQTYQKLAYAVELFTLKSAQPQKY